jgi:hypothetical protein
VDCKPSSSTYHLRVLITFSLQQPNIIYLSIAIFLRSMECPQSLPAFRQKPFWRKIGRVNVINIAIAIAIILLLIACIALGILLYKLPGGDQEGDAIGE